MKGFQLLALAGVASLAVTARALAATGLGQGVPATRPSSTRVWLQLRDQHGELSYASLPEAFHDLDSRYGAVRFTDVRVLDYSTYGSKDERTVRAERAYFLVDAQKAGGTTEDLKIVAFADRATARKYQRQIGGELRDFEDAWQAVTEARHGNLRRQVASAARAPSAADPPVPPRHPVRQQSPCSS